MMTSQSKDVQFLFPSEYKAKKTNTFLDPVQLKTHLLDIKKHFSNTISL